jgi:hypothetical protein
MSALRRRAAARLIGLGAVAAATLTGVTAPAAVGADRGPALPTAGLPSAPLDLGPADLTETRAVDRLQPGVTLTTIRRGSTDPSSTWTLEVRIPSVTDPSTPPRVLADVASAELEADRLRERGVDARVEAVARPRAVDVAPGELGWRVRVGSWPTRAEAEAALTGLTAVGGLGSAVFTGWDGDTTARGPWTVRVLSVDPSAFSGSVVGSYGPDLERRETTSALAAAQGATAAVNGGYFVLDPASGAPGDPAGIGVYRGRLLSEPVDGRPGLVLRADGRGSIGRFAWAGEVLVQGRRHTTTLPLDGLDRVPGLIRNCGGEPTDTPTALPLHDVTCTDGSEVVSFTREFGATTPTGPGTELVLDRRGTVVEVRDGRGTTLADGTTSVQAVGEAATQLARARTGDRVRLRSWLQARSDGRRPVTAAATVVNGGPMLVQDGKERITQAADGFVRPGDPTFSYGFVAKRNPRTFAGIDRAGRTLLVTVDGRSVDDLGLSIPETADVARSLGMVDALNLDGGGSTAMVVAGVLVSRPSDTSGERPVGDAVLVLPDRRR